MSSAVTGPATSCEDQGKRTFVFLQPGQLFACGEPAQMTTILGSCVAVCLFDVGAGVSGINHFMLPHWVGSNASSPRFGNVAMAMLFERILALGARPGQLKARVFGGARVLGATAPGVRHLGLQNAHLATEALREAHIPVLTADVGGERGRRIVFTSDGVVRVSLC